jgi:hypothetical protein
MRTTSLCRSRAQEVDAAHLRHPLIGHDHLRTRAFDQFEGFARCTRSEHINGFVPQQTLQRFQNVDFVIDE